MMELCHITAGYGGPPVLRDVSLAFEPGKVTVLAGPNGCGKSTLLRVAARLMAPERGEVRIEGQDVSRLSAKQFARLAALLPQSRRCPASRRGAWSVHGRSLSGYPRRLLQEDREAARREMEGAGVLIDCVFGFSFRGELSGLPAQMLGFANGAPCLRVSADLPSGVECDTGRVSAGAFRADVTVTFTGEKASQCFLPRQGVLWGDRGAASRGARRPCGGGGDPYF